MKRLNRKKLNDLYNITSAVFADLQTLDVPWKSKDIATQLDIAYMGNQSGNKYISPLLQQFVGTDGTISQADRATVASVIFALYNEQWTKLYNTLSLQYDPIENYHMVETMTNDETVTEYGRKDTRTDNLTHRIAGSEILTHDTTETLSDDVKKEYEGGEMRTPRTDTKNEVYAYNSTEPSPTSKSINGGTESTQYLNRNDTEAGTHTTTKSGSETNTYQGRIDSDNGTQENQSSGEDTSTRNYTLERAGNIGVTSSQQLIESERTLWLWNFFYKVVFPDVDRVLALSIY